MGGRNGALPATRAYRNNCDGHYRSRSLFVGNCRRGPLGAFPAQGRRRQPRRRSHDGSHRGHVLAHAVPRSARPEPGSPDRGPRGRCASSSPREDSPDAARCARRFSISASTSAFSSSLSLRLRMTSRTKSGGTGDGAVGAADTRAMMPASSCAWRRSVPMTSATLLTGPGRGTIWPCSHLSMVVRETPERSLSSVLPQPRSAISLITWSYQGRPGAFPWSAM